MDYSAEPPSLSYQWSASGGNIVSANNNITQIDWGGSNEAAAVRAIPTDPAGCKGDQVTFPVRIRRELKPARPTGQDSVCLNFSIGVPYSTSYTNSSIYTWMVSAGSIKTGQGTSKALVDWPGIGSYRIWVSEENTTETDYCTGHSDTLYVKVFKDSASITIDFVSTLLDDDSKIKLKWQTELISRISDLIIISRRKQGETTWTEIIRVNKVVTEFLDELVTPNEVIYEYKIEGFNRCDEGIQTLIQNNVRLLGEGEEQTGKIDLEWNPYVNWQQGVDHYEIWRKLDNAKDFELIDVTQGNTLEARLTNGLDGFRHTLRVKAKQAGRNVASWSNEIKVEFEHNVFVPNVITVNGDGLNETFKIERLEVYKQNALKIFDRDGTMVYSSSPYKNDWDGNGLATGVYFYSLKLSPLHRPITGWVQVIR